MSVDMLPLYPEIEPYKTDYFKMEALSSGDCHRIYVEQCGNPEGIPVIFLHGGPGSGCRPLHRRYFDPKKYRIILFDQRGCGRSTPLGELENNTSQFLLNDMEAIRHHLNIHQWLIFGGSWGATLGLLYAQHYPQNVLAMILRGTFLGRQQDINWVYAEGGASKLFPEAWNNLVKDLDTADKKMPLKAYFEQLTNSNIAVQQAAASTLQSWESTIVTLRDHHYQPKPNNDPDPLAHSRIQLHYALNDCFILEHPLLENIASIRHIPAHIIHGRYDTVCPVQQSWELQQVWPEAKLTVVPLAGHAAGEPAIIDALVASTREFSSSLS
jgi:proline iminopeptidase